MRVIAMIVLLCISACTTVVTSTSTEVRPSRYAVLEYTRAVSQDSIIAYAQRALAAENIRIIDVDRSAGVVKGGPVAIAATADQPALQAEVNISAQAIGSETRIRVFATALLEPNQIGGQDARLMALIQRIEQRLDSLIGH